MRPCLFIIAGITKPMSPYSDWWLNYTTRIVFIISLKVGITVILMLTNVLFNR